MVTYQKMKLENLLNLRLNKLYLNVRIKHIQYVIINWYSQITSLIVFSYIFTIVIIKNYIY